MGSNLPCYVAYNVRDRKAERMQRIKQIETDFQKDVKKIRFDLYNPFDPFFYPPTRANNVRDRMAERMQRIKQMGTDFQKDVEKNPFLSAKSV